MGVVLCSQDFEYMCFTLVDKGLVTVFQLSAAIDDGQSCRNVQQMSTKLGSLSVGVVK